MAIDAGKPVLTDADKGSPHRPVMSALESEIAECLFIDRAQRTPGQDCVRAGSMLEEYDNDLLKIAYGPSNCPLETGHIDID
ncbi:hypothetical protein LMG29542_06443 [Paraburkholderia humisilvae]|uniref:Uncharacterized protein n=1 Tax=Paraburkholderia humisilvae TaxID=627669 RepID=A0A6J5EZR2_9BURK|nr:hypothetical protein [Paraburkholderia humisilvae]CAB3770792.1 hypothetical protein LMG29542_06443 [Paraburkholderia humisilvae]